MHLLIKFRHKDVTIEDRMRIGFFLTYQKYHGIVTALATRYNVSRPFIYRTGKFFTDITDYYHAKSSPEAKAEEVQKAVESVTRQILSLRLDGKCCINSIHKVLGELGACHDSVGYISEMLTESGEKVGNSLFGKDFENAMTFVFASDEIFANGRPILITVEPISLTILKIELADNRSAAAWQAHFESLKGENIQPLLLVKDEGTGLKAAQKACLPDVPVQSDTFHGVAHRLGAFMHRFEKRFQTALEMQKYAENLYFKSKSDETAEKRYQRWLILANNTAKAFALRRDFAILYHFLLDCFQPFDRHGIVKDETTVISDFDETLLLLQALNDSAINDEIKSITASKSTLFTFFKSTKTMVQTLAKTIDTTVLNYFCLAHQHHKNHVKAKKTAQQTYHKTHEQNILNLLYDELKDDFDTLKTLIYSQLSTIVQSSAAVECINSILRPYLNSSRGQLSQSALNLFMFYHNHRIFEAGARKGKSPMQLLTGEKHDPWLDLLVAKIAAN